MILFLPSFLVVSMFTGIRQFEGMDQREAVGKLGVEAFKAGAQRIVGPTDTGRSLCG